MIMIMMMMMMNKGPCMYVGRVGITSASFFSFAVLRMSQNFDYFFFQKTTTLHPGRIRSRDPGAHSSATRHEVGINNLAESVFLFMGDALI
jgi:hypothetical protein